MPTESVKPSNHLILFVAFSSCLQSFPAPGSFPVSRLSASSSQSIGVSASVSVLPMNIQDLFPLGFSDSISLLSKGTLKSLLQNHISKVSVLWCLAFLMVQLSHMYMTTGKTTLLTIWAFVGKVMCLIFNMLSRFVRAFFPRRLYLLTL